MRVTEDTNIRLVAKEYPQEAILTIVLCLLGASIFLFADDGLWANTRDPEKGISDYGVTGLVVLILIGIILRYGWKGYAIRLELDADQGWVFLHKEGFFRNASAEWPLEAFRGARAQTRISSGKGINNYRREHRAILIFEIDGRVIEIPVTSLLTTHKGTIPTVARINAWQAARGAPVLGGRGDGPPLESRTAAPVDSRAPPP
ncbi:hypothetical protein AADZ90_004855 [Aestuariibius sp. 2305UL40-4]|uniref:hypothetical protein n=1 Tax=Aestuariibius violaceus TaxID=3234132 RepID=UPI00345EE65F